MSIAGTNLSNVRISGNLSGATLWGANLQSAKLSGTLIVRSEFNNCNLDATDFTKASIGDTKFIRTDLSKAKGLDDLLISGPSSIDIDSIRLSKGKIPLAFLRGCGLSDWEIESSRLSDPDLGNEAINKILYKIYDLRASQPIQISPLFISYSHADSIFVDKLESLLNKRGIRFWRDIHDMKSGRMEKQIDHAIHLNPTVLLILSEHSLQSDWVVHEVRTARSLEKEMKKDVLCPVALDNSWKSSSWAKRIMEQIMEYNILDFSDWKDDTKFAKTFNKLIDGLDLFYK